MNRRDLQLIFLILLISFAVFTFTRIMSNNIEDESYVIIYVGTEEYQRISLSNPQIVTIDRNGKYNEVKVTSNGAVMHASNCENEDCLHQGEVTLENIHTRPLGPWIMCLPNQVTIELVKGDEE
ncbi:NusG domain II-containing protein [Natronincola ferrireducens]|uniref:Uncharacterized protein n=1 Tax=Natronincola ferrireducens TaxID=393762 RepID=A0A1G8Z5S8_9FIRM|nr:NusG domain II-containing protein [Natronincola ferrireducens]SDK10429.1 hypothetical protein SAMN05660472_00747 [Natronincola ferrireducens]